MVAAMFRAGAEGPDARRAAGEDLEIGSARKRGQELFWGGAACWWGELRPRLTPNAAPFSQPVECPVEGMLPDLDVRSDSHAVVHDHSGPNGRSAASRKCCRRFRTWR